ncbi:MAG: hypothetical protein EA396_08410 [Anaerolineaceae bacterium]|nr:MAG: hypothetical protein EA396_08410 [Anaerolineaceae bacterium]
MTNSISSMAYRHSADGIHRFDFIVEERIEASPRDVIDVFAAKLREIYAAAPADSHVRLLINIKDANVSLRVLARRIKPFFDEFTERPSGSLAIVTTQGSALTLLNNFLSLFSRSKDRFRFFRTGEEAEAREWLLQGG